MNNKLLEKVNVTNFCNLNIFLLIFFCLNRGEQLKYISQPKSLKLNNMITKTV